MADEGVLESQIQGAFVKLDAAVQRKQHKKVLKATEEILSLVPEDVTAKHCKLVALVQLGQVEKAYKLLSTKQLSLPSGLEKEQAYCFYRNGHVSKAFDMLGNGTDEGQEGLLELKGQLLYRLGRMEESKDVYEKILKNQKGDVKSDLLGNIIASYLAAGEAENLRQTVLHNVSDKTLQETPEIAYNHACLSVALGNYEDAMRQLEVAEKVGYEALYEEDLTEEEIKEELSHVFAQKAYVALKLGRDAEATDGNASVLKTASDEATLAIATNNLAASRGGAQAFDSMKRFEKLSSGKGGATALELAPEFTEGLTQEEVVTMMLNYGSVCLLGNRMDAVEQTAKNILRMAPATAGAAVLHAAALAKKDQTDQAMQVLDAFASKHPASAAQCYMAKCELACSVGKPKVGAQALVQLPEEVKYQPGALATIVSLFSKSHDAPQASSTVDGATQWWESNIAGSQASSSEMKKYVNVMSIAAQYKFQQKDVDTAAALYQKVLQKTDDPTLRSQAMGGLVQLHGVEDSSLADKYESEMPAIPGIEEMDVEILEQTTISKSSRPAVQSASLGGGESESFEKKATTESSSAMAQDAYVPATKGQQKRDFLKTLPAERQEFVVQRQRACRQAKRRKRVAKENAKHPKPKKIDAERWLPKRDRSTYKKTRKEKLKAKNKVKGSQGAGKVDQSLDRSSAPANAGPKLPKGKGKRRK